MDAAHGLMALVAGLFFAPLAVLFGFFVAVMLWHPIAAMLRRSAEARAMAAQQRRLLAAEMVRQAECRKWVEEHPEEVAAMERQRLAVLSYGGRYVAGPPALPRPVWPPGMDPRQRAKAKASDGIPSAEDLRRQFSLPAKRDRLLR